MSSCYISLPFYLLLAFLSLLSHGDSNFPQPPQTSPKPSSGSKVSMGEGPGVQMQPVEGPGVQMQPDEYSYVVLAAERTQRKDPLNGFKRYTGGWNISDRHYWSSVGFTAVPLFAIAAIWFLGFGLVLSLFCLCHFCFHKREYGYSQTAYALSLILLALSSIAAIAGCVVLYMGQEKFHHSTTSALDYVVSQADFTVGKLNNVSDYLAQAKQLGVDQVFLPPNVQTDIDQIGTKINTSASNLADTTSDNSDDIKDLLDSV